MNKFGWLELLNSLAGDCESLQSSVSLQYLMVAAQNLQFVPVGSSRSLNDLGHSRDRFKCKVSNHVQKCQASLGTDEILVGGLNPDIEHTVIGNEVSEVIHDPGE